MSNVLWRTMYVIAISVVIILGSILGNIFTVLYTKYLRLYIINVIYFRNLLKRAVEVCDCKMSWADTVINITLNIKLNVYLLLLCFLELKLRHWSCDGLDI